MDYNNLVVLQFFGLVLGVAVLIMCTVEFEPDEIVAGDVFHLRLTTTAVAERTSKRPRPIAGPVVAIRFRILLPEMNIRLLWFVTGGLLQAARMHKFLHLGVNFMLNFCVLQYSFGSCNPLLDKSVFLVTSVVALLARRLVEFFLNIGIRFGFGSFGIRLGMAGPVIANDFRRRREAGRGKGIVLLLRITTRHWQMSVTGN